MKKSRSWVFLGGDVDGAEVEKVGVGIVAVDFENFRDESSARPSLDVDYDVERIGDVRLNRIGAIYRTHWTNLFAFYGLHLSDFERDQAMFAPPRTQLVPDSPEAEETIIVPLQSHEALRLDQTTLFSKLADIWGEVPVRLIQQMDLRNGTYGFVGMGDNRMSPLIRPGSIVQIDQNQRKILNVKWDNEYDRPIYFLELRGAYLCSWCEIGGGYLSAIPHPNSKCEVRRFAYPREADIVGRVVCVTNRLAASV
jgi:hypothetical protein